MQCIINPFIICPGKDWADFYNLLHMNPSCDQMKPLPGIIKIGEF